MGDFGISAGMVADRQDSVPADKRPAELTEAQKRANFAGAYERSLRDQGVGPSPTTSK